MLDPTCPDISAGVLEALGAVGSDVGQLNVQNAIDDIRCSQAPWGAWIGRWAVNWLRWGESCATDSVFFGSFKNERFKYAFSSFFDIQHSWIYSQK